MTDAPIDLHTRGLAGVVAGDGGRRPRRSAGPGWGAFAAIFGRPDVSPLVARLLLDLGPLPIWIRPAVVGSASRDETSLQQGVLLYLVHRGAAAGPRGDGPAGAGPGRRAGAGRGRAGRRPGQPAAEALAACGHGPGDARLLAGPSATWSAR
ncbi:MAG: hypothetical protein R3F43_20290 [bacterium]